MANDTRISQAPRVAVTTDPAAPIDVTQMARVGVTLAAQPADVTQMARIAITASPQPLEVSQMARVTVTRNFVPGSNDQCRIYVVT